MGKATKFKFIVFLGLILVVIVPGFAMAANLGEIITFNVDPAYDKSARSDIDATLFTVSDKAYFYVENDWWNSLSDAKKSNVESAIHTLANEFDINIYNKVTAIYGKEWSPGIDNDTKISIIVTQLIDSAGGYFNSSDEYFKTQVSVSNEREMIYLNASYIDDVRVKAFLGHEMQHLISFYQKEKLKNVVEDIWLNEARSEYVATLLGYNDPYSTSYLKKRVDAYITNPNDSLTEWRNETSDYSPVNLFMQYFVDHFGQSIISGMMNNSQGGINSINGALSNAGYTETFNDIFNRWTVANYVNDCSIDNGKYCYYNSFLSSSVLKLIPDNTYILPPGSSNSVFVQSLAKDWSTYSVRFSPQITLTSSKPDILKLEFKTSASSEFAVPYITTNSIGQKNIKYLNIIDGTGILYLTGWGRDIKDLILLPSPINKMSNFTNNESLYSYSYYATLINEIPTDVSQPVIDDTPTIAPNYSDGALIRAKGDIKVYIVKNGKYKRWIQNPAIFNMYGHFKWNSIIEVTQAEVDFYKESTIVRTDGDTKVYEITQDGFKRWINMTPEQFTISGRMWDSIYIINYRERDVYKLGYDVKA